MNYEKDMYIDVTALDVEWTEQAELTMRYGRLWAEAQAVSDRAEEQVKLTRSELVLKANKNPDDALGIGIKPTDSKVEAYYRTHEDYLDVKDEAIEASKQLNLISIAKNEIAFTRKAALENLVILNGQQYFAGPKVPRNLKMEVDQRKAARELTKERSNRKVRIRKND